MELNKPPKFHRNGIKGLIDKLAIGKERAEYGVARVDTWAFYDYAAVVLANGLRILAQDSNGWPGTEEYPTAESWTAKLNEIADKLIQAATTDEQIDLVFNEIEWGQEDFRPTGLEDFSDWFKKETSTPAFKEYSRRSDEIRDLAEKNLKEALDWMVANWWSLWD